MAACIALLRGINVGRAKRIAMADLRTLLATLGYSDVRTLLNSGNAVFQAPRPNPGKISAAIETAIQRHCGFSAPVIVLTAPELDAVIAENALPQAVRDPSKFLVAFASTAASLARFRPLLEKSWAPDVLAVGPRAAYLWCANGIAESKLALEFMRATGDTMTTRNWATVLKLQAAAGTRPHAA